MANEISLPVKPLFESISFDRDADSWIFSFTDKVCIVADGFWRLFKNDHIVCVSLDHEHLFGLQKPFNLIEDLKNRLTGNRLTTIEIKDNSGDLVAKFEDNHKLEVLISSTGYETYSISINGRRYIGLGSGNIAIIEDKP